MVGWPAKRSIMLSHDDTSRLEDLSVQRNGIVTPTPGPRKRADALLVVTPYGPASVGGGSAPPNQPRDVVTV
jgi:hypothetical protein